MRLRLLLLLLVAACLTAAALPLVALSPAAQRAVADWRRAVAAAQARPARQLSNAVETEIHRRSAVDRAARLALEAAIKDLSPADRHTASEAIWVDLRRIDQANLDYVKSVLPADGWFRTSRDGAITTAHAWLIIHHSDDWPFKRQLLGRLAELAAAGEIRPGNYALFYDRVAQHDGRPQRYGTQFDCRDGRLVHYQVENPERLDARRAAVGLEPVAEYLRDMVGKPC